MYKENWKCTIFLNLEFDFIYINSLSYIFPWNRGHYSYQQQRFQTQGTFRRKNHSADRIFWYTWSGTYMWCTPWWVGVSYHSESGTGGRSSLEHRSKNYSLSLFFSISSILLRCSWTRSTPFLWIHRLLGPYYCGPRSSTCNGTFLP